MEWSKEVFYGEFFFAPLNSQEIPFVKSCFARIEVRWLRLCFELLVVIPLDNVGVAAIGGLPELAGGEISVVDNFINAGDQFDGGG